MSPNELSSALKCSLELTVRERSAETTYKQELDFVRSYCCVGEIGKGAFWDSYDHFSTIANLGVRKI